MSDCITALIAAIIIALFLGDSRENNRCSRNRSLCSSNDRSDSFCGGCDER